MPTIPTTPPRAKHRAALWARLTRRHFAPGDPSKCHQPQRLVADPGNPRKVLCPQEGRPFLRIAA